MQNESDVIIIGGGIAGLTAARHAVLNGLSYTILEANSEEWLGGRVHTESIDLKPFNNSYPLPPLYKFEHGGAWLHGLENSVTLELLNKLHYEHYPEMGEKYITETQLFEVFQGCSWLLPEFIPYNQIVLFDPKTSSFITPLQYLLYLAITVVHLRGILRKYPCVSLNKFAQTYVNWIEKTLPLYSLPSHSISPEPKSLSELDREFGDAGISENGLQSEIVKDNASIASVVARAIGFYFHSVEGYHGIPTGEMHNQYLFHPLTDKVYGDMAVFDEVEVMEDVLNGGEAKVLFAILDEWIQVGQKQIEISRNVDEKAAKSQNDDKKAQNCRESQIIADVSPDLIKLYQDSKYNILDTDTHGCYIGPHCVMKCGMSKLTQLMVLDIEKKSQKPLNIRYNHRVTTLSHTEIDGDDRVDVFNTATYEVDVANEQKNDENGENNVYIAKKAIILTGSIPSLIGSIKLQKGVDNSIVFENDDSAKALISKNGDRGIDIFEEVLSKMGKTTKSVYYKKVAHCFPTPWWPRADTTRVVGVLQSVTDMNTVGLYEGDDLATLYEEKRDFSQGLKGYSKLFENFSQKWNQKDENDEKNKEIHQNKSKFLLPNILFESHQPSKGVPVLSGSVVGNLAKALTDGIRNIDNNHKTIENASNCTNYAENDVIASNLTLHALNLVYTSLNSDGNALPEPLFSRNTKWGETPAFKHSYSFVDDPALGTASRITIASKHGLFFTGEGIDVYDTGSIHAAITTAQHAIKFILDGVVDMVDDEDDEDCEWTVVGEEDGDESDQ